MSNIKVDNIEAFAVGDIIKPSAVNIIQDGLDEITKLWGLQSAGSARAEAGKPASAALINNWVSWLNTYAVKIGCPSLVGGTSIGMLIRQSFIDKVYSATQEVKNYCNRSECNTNECDNNECDNSECDDYECDYPECQDSECDSDTECDDGECCGGEW